MKNEIQTLWENSDPLGAIVIGSSNAIKTAGTVSGLPGRYVTAVM